MTAPSGLSAQVDIILRGVFRSEFLNCNWIRSGYTTLLVVFALGAGGAFGAPKPQAAGNAATPATSGATTAAAAKDPAEFRPLLDTYCVGCHNERLKTAGLMLDKADLKNVPQASETWENVIRKLRSGAMPPTGLPRPEPSVSAAFVSSLAATLDRAAAAQPNPGRPLLHRLNRAEYANAIRDVLALDIDVTSLLPPDDSSHGFDNIADSLGVSPALLDRYLAAARKISEVAVGDPDTPLGADTYFPRGDSVQADHVEGLPFGTRGGLLIRKTFPVDAYYTITAKLFITNLGFMRGVFSPHVLIFTVDGKEVFRNTVGTAEDYNQLVASALYAETINARLHARVPIKAGPRIIGVTFVQKGEGEALQMPTPLRPLLAAGDPIDVVGLPKVDTVQIAGPYDVVGRGDTPSRHRIFSCYPASSKAEEPCARTVLSTLARNAWRRPVTDADIASLLEFYRMGRQKRDFDAGIELALRRMLADPSFIFRAERDPAGVAPGAAYRISDLELASRLSFFLWSSVPDPELIDIASQGKLRDPAVLSKQVRRMLADSKSDALVSNFADQWLHLRNLKRVSPNPAEFPDFDDTLRQAMQTETEMLFASVMREDRPVQELLTSDYTFVNERLARHYRIPNIYGDQFRRIAITDEARKGLLGQASILTVTSYPNRTSPVQRGKWILENVLGTPPPPPPPNVPALKEESDPSKQLTMRERMEQHRAVQPCAGCHKLFDPLGLAMENFDATGAWRVKDGAASIDSSSLLADGTKVDGTVGLREMLLRRPDMFAGTLIEKLMTYATGRGIEYYDMPAVRTVERESARDNYRFESLIIGVVSSVPFQMRVAAPEPASAAVAGTVARRE